MYKLLIIAVLLNIRYFLMQRNAKVLALENINRLSIITQQIQ